MSRIRDAAAQIVRPLQQFTQTETTGGVLLLPGGLPSAVSSTKPRPPII